MAIALHAFVKHAFVKHAFVKHAAVKFASMRSGINSAHRRSNLAQCGDALGQAREFA